MLKPNLNEKIERNEFSLHNSLHGSRPLLPKHPHSILAPQFHPLESTRHAKYNLCCGTEGRGFKPRRSPQIFSFKI
jgi:hypothetical protein